MHLLTTSFAALLLLGTYANAQDATPEEAAATFTINNSTYVLYHEVGHLLIGELGIPVLGKEEDAVDNLASLLLLNAETDEADNALIDSADGWFMSDEAAAGQEYDDAEFYDVHSLDVQRAFQVLCLMVGANQEIFGEIATEYGMDEERQQSCTNDFSQTAASWAAVLEPFELATPSSDKITVIYEPSKEHGAAAELLQSVNYLESAAEGIIAHYDLPRPVSLRGADCGEENAYYDPEAGEVVFCYELADLYHNLATASQE